MANVFTKLFGSRNQRLLRGYRKIVVAANSFSDSFEQLSDQELQAKTAEFRQRLKDGEELDALLPEAFAAVRESARRTLGLRHYDEQLLGGLSLHRGLARRNQLCFPLQPLNLPASKSQ